MSQNQSMPTQQVADIRHVSKSTIAKREPEKDSELAGFAPVGYFHSPVFHREFAPFSGNDYRDLGKIITEV